MNTLAHVSLVLGLQIAAYDFAIAESGQLADASNKLSTAREDLFLALAQPTVVLLPKYLQTLIDFSSGRIEHLNGGLGHDRLNKDLCPDRLNNDFRDPSCPVCIAIDAAMKETS